MDRGTIRRLAVAGIRRAAVYGAIDSAAVLGPRSAYRAIARWSDVIYVDDDTPLRFFNYATKKDTHVDRVRAGMTPLRHGYTGRGTTVAILDSGIEDAHPDLRGRVVKSMNFQPAVVLDDISDGAYTDRVAETTGDAPDLSGHGTHLAGIVAGTGAAGVGADYSGVAPGAVLVNLKIGDAHTDEEIGWEVNALAAYEYAIDHHRDKVFPGGIRVLSNSWGLEGTDEDARSISRMVSEASRRGLISVFAAGNSGPADHTVAPGPNRSKDVITVAAACKSVDSCRPGDIARFSSRGPEVDIAAPGDNVYSTAVVGSRLVSGSHAPRGSAGNGAYYVGYSGTSIAAPHVAGVIALMLEANPSLGREQVYRMLIETASDRGASGFDHAWGHGLVNAHAAVARAEPTGAGSGRTTATSLQSPTASSRSKVRALARVGSDGELGGPARESGTHALASLANSPAARGPLMALATASVAAAVVLLLSWRRATRARPG